MKKKNLFILALVIYSFALYGEKEEVLSKVEITKLYHVGCKVYINRYGNFVTQDGIILGDVYGYPKIGVYFLSTPATYKTVVYASLHDNNGHTWKEQVTKNDNTKFTWEISNHIKSLNKSFIYEFNKAEAKWYLKTGYVYVPFPKKIDKPWNGAEVMLKVSYQHKGKGDRKVSKSKEHKHEVKIYPTQMEG